MGLIYPHDLADWQRWQTRHQPLTRRARHLLTRSTPNDPTLTLTLHGERPRVLVALDSRSPTSRLALLDPVSHLEAHGVAVLEAGTNSTAIGPGGLSDQTALDDVRAVVALGHYLEVGAAAHRFARDRELPFAVVQHGLLTPHMAPLPPHAHLLAWSREDAAFWADGRPDVVRHVVGSQLLWKAARQPAPRPSTDAGAVFLGQLHAAELSRRAIARASEAFCRTHGATYRPHPAERDKLSRLQHAWWRRRGLRVGGEELPLAEMHDPVVSIFSTGILEAAARGIPAWVTFPDPPPWLLDFWDRYDMRPWGGAPTPAPSPSRDEPALAIARFLQEDL